MSIWTLYFDIAGRATEQSISNEFFSIGGLVINTEDEENIRRFVVNKNIKKWKYASKTSLDGIINIISKWAIFAEVYQFRKTQPYWDQFWRKGENTYRDLLKVAEKEYKGSHKNRKLRIARPANFLRSYLFSVSIGYLTHTCIKENKLSNIVNINGHKILKQNLVFDYDITGKENQELFIYSLSLWPSITKMPEIFKIQPELGTIKILRVTQDPNLLIVDNLAGVFQYIAKNKIILPHNNLSEKEVKSYANKFVNLRNFNYKILDFKFEYPGLNYNFFLNKLN